MRIPAKSCQAQKRKIYIDPQFILNYERGMNKCIEIEQAAKKCGLPIAEMCKRAGINRATWQRWKSGAISPTMRNWDKVNAVVDAASDGK